MAGAVAPEWAGNAAVIPATEAVAVVVAAAAGAVANASPGCSLVCSLHAKRFRLRLNSHALFTLNKSKKFKD